MKSKERNPRKKIDKKSVDLFKPIGIGDFGSEDDCFGKLHDVTEPECKRCGDSEFCSIIMAQNARLKRSNDPVKYKDEEVVIPPEKDEQIAVPRLIKSYIKKGKKLKSIKKLILRKFPETNPERLVRLYKKYKKQ